MKKKMLKDLRRRRLVSKYEHIRVVLKSIINNSLLDENIRQVASLKLDSLPKNSSKVRIKNKCIVTGRSRGVHRSMKMSRIVLKEFLLSGKMPGAIKYSW